ncbi:MAG TPA: LysM peptidoglycan-binding domain-containing protein [Flavobacteriales bacterium]|nr:LysM peptidoglycan-binding domain-containing protein [Flavobacteriales bacterium]
MLSTRVLLLAVVLPTGLFAQAPVPADDPVLEQLDRLSRLPWLKNDPFTTDVSVLNVHHFAATDTPSYKADVYRQRLNILDERTPFKLTYNEPVQSYIDLYAKRKREQTSRMLGLAQLYFPVFEEALDRYNMPQELKYLAVVESALFPGAKSRAAAVGLWQFMIGTGKLYGLQADSYVDERCDIYESTDAACRYLRDLYKIFGNWELALAAYNCGPGNVNKAVRRAGGTLDYWSVYNYLPRETRGYVPAFIAVNYIFNHAADHNIYPTIPNYCAYEVDTVHVCYPLSFETLAKITGGNAQELRDLNPMFKQGVVPDLDQPVTVYIPHEMVNAFIREEDAIAHSYIPDLSAPAPMNGGNGMARAVEAQASRTHVVRRGETVGTIARKNGVSAKDLRAWNHLRSDRLRAGQRLVVRVTARNAGTEQAEAAKKKEEAKPPTAEQVTATPTTPAAVNPVYIYHTVQPGDTLWGIAQRYPGATVDEIKRLNSGVNLRHLAVGKKLKVAVQKG